MGASLSVFEEDTALPKPEASLLRLRSHRESPPLMAQRQGPQHGAVVLSITIVGSTDEAGGGFGFV